MKKRERQKTASREAIVASAAGLLRRGGFGGTSVQAAMAGAGLTVGGFYAHFSDKSALCDEAFFIAMGGALDLVTHAATGRNGTDAVNAILGAYLSEVHRDHPEMGCPLPATSGEAAVRPGTSSAVIAEGVSAMTGRVEELTGTTPAEAVSLVALMIGGQILARAVSSEPDSDEILAACRTVGARLATPLGTETGQ